MIQHWIGLFHGISRTVLVLGAWFLFPSHRFVAIPAVIVVMNLVTIFVLLKRWRPERRDRREVRNADRGLFSVTKAKAKSVVLSEEGERLARDLFENYFRAI